MPKTCPKTSAEARAHHDAVKADAATGVPVTPHGRHLLATRREWPGVGFVGECLCRTSLVVVDPTLADADAFTVPRADEWPVAVLRNHLSRR